jgi:hypothetical protein
VHVHVVVGIFTRKCNYSVLNEHKTLAKTWFGHIQLKFHFLIITLLCTFFCTISHLSSCIYWNTTLCSHHQYHPFNLMKSDHKDHVQTFNDTMPTAHNMWIQIYKIHVCFSTFQLHYAPRTPKTLSPTTLFSPSLKDTKFYNYTK